MFPNRILIGWLVGACVLSVCVCVCVGAVGVNVWIPARIRTKKKGGKNGNRGNREIDEAECIL